jgi:hypothetical protein
MPWANTGTRTCRVPWADLLKRILLHLGLDSRGPPVARVQAPPDFSEPGPRYDGADPVYAD